MVLLLRHTGSVLLLLISILSPARVAGADELPRFDGHLSQFIYLKPLQAVRPAFFRDADDRDVGFERFRGRVVLVNLWATWCAPCTAEMPALDRLQGRLRDARFAVVAIALNIDGLAPVAAFFRRQQMTHLAIYLDPEHRTIRSDPAVGADAALPLYQLPTSYLLDEQGRAIGYLRGPADWDSEPAVDFVEYFIARSKDRHGAAIGHEPMK